MRKKKRIRSLVICMVIIAAGIYVFNSSLLVDKIYENNAYVADTLLVYRSGSDQGTLLTDATEIAAIQNSYKWTNFHIECCAGAPDFRVYVYQDGEPVAEWYGYHDPNNDAYNRAFAQRISELGQRPSNVWVSEMTIPSGVYPKDIAATLKKQIILPRESEESDARGPHLLATYTVFFDRYSALGKAAYKDCPLGEFPEDDIFLPLQEALIKEGVLRSVMIKGVLRSVSDVDCHMWVGAGAESYAERSIVFYLEEEPSFTEFGALTLVYSDGGGWQGFLVSDAPVSENEWVSLKQIGIEESI